MEGEAGNNAVRFADALPTVSHLDLADDGTSRVLNHRQVVLPGDSQNRGQITRQADLVNRHDGLGPRRDGGLDQGRVHVVSPRIDVDKDRGSAAVNDDVGRGDKRVADSNDFVARTDVQSV